jgi:DNA (cytosine-5)-methyltransferase 1
MWRDSSSVCDTASPWKPVPKSMATPLELRRDDHAFLQARTLASPARQAEPFTWVDMFAGCGAMSLGIWEAVVAMGRAPRIALAIDHEAAALSVFKANFPAAETRSAGVEEIFAPLGSAKTVDEKALAGRTGKVDLLVGGPPCQGHSDLNNFSRRSDLRNSLYSSMARAAYVLDPSFVIIENVPGLAHDRSQVLQHTIVSLLEMGYSVSSAIVDASDYGVPQRRKRHLLMASKRPLSHVDGQLAAFMTTKRSVRWAIEDLVGIDSKAIVDQASTPSRDNRARINYLFENSLYDLPNSERPPCHRSRSHSYGSVYGRMRWEEPAQTVTSGFYSMCMGRYVHPALRRTLTAHEAARLQFLPDFFSFESVKSRTALARLIANAVPPKLAYVAASALVGSG